MSINEPDFEPDFPPEGCALVAGGSGGIGRAIVRLLVAGGANVALTYRRNERSAQEAVTEIESGGGSALAGQVPLEDETQVSGFVGRVAETFGGIHTVVYAAGPFIEMRHISRIEPALFRSTMEQDAFGFFNLVHASLPHLRDSRGALVAVATPALRRYAVKDVLSVAPKAAVEALVRGVAAEEGRFGVRANAVGVGLLQDGMYHALVESGAFDEAYIEAGKRNIALRRLGTAEEIAEAVTFLASRRARWITGQTLMVDGGYAL